MNDKELLEVLKNEMLLAEARAKGAKEAYEWKALCVARTECNLRPGDKIIIKFSDGDMLASFEDVKWSSYEFRGYKGPGLYGRRILKSGAKSKIQQALCTFEMLRGGHVKPANAPANAAGVQPDRG